MTEEVRGLDDQRSYVVRAAFCCGRPLGQGSAADVCAKRLRAPGVVYRVSFCSLDTFVGMRGV